MNNDEKMIVKAIDHNYINTEDELVKYSLKKLEKILIKDVNKEEKIRDIGNYNVEDALRVIPAVIRLTV